MELRQLRYFVAVAETGNISRAAKKIFLTQPALSRQIRALEEEIGQRLLVRKANSVQLTPAGELMYSEAIDILARTERALERVRQVARGMRLCIGYAPSLSAGLLSAAVQSFTQAHPEVGVELHDLSTSEMISGLEKEELDAILTVPAQSTRTLRWTTLIRAPYRLAVNRKHRLAARARLTPADVAREPLLILSQKSYPEYLPFITNWLESHGAKPRIAGEHESGESLMTAVESGLGVALVTTRTAQLYPGRVVLKPITHAPPPLRVGVGCLARRLKEPPLAVFVGELKRTADLARNSDP